MMISYRYSERYGNLHRSPMLIVMELASRVIIHWMVDLGYVQDNQMFVWALCILELVEREQNVQSLP